MVRNYIYNRLLSLPLDASLTLPKIISNAKIPEAAVNRRLMFVIGKLATIEIANITRKIKA